MRVPVNNAGGVGLITDVAPHELPFNAWTSAQNVRFKDGQVQKMAGQSIIITNPVVAPYWVMAVQTLTQSWWMYAGLTKVYGYDGATHFDISDIVYSASADLNWTGGILGSIPVLNNAVDPPKMWNPVNGAQVLATLTNWPASTSCRAFRVFKNWLVALDVIKTGTRYPQMVKWSSGAPGGTIPATWDPTDTTHDAGEYNLMETNGFVVDCCPLRDVNIIYKEDQVWGMQWIGGLNVFKFYKIFSDIGILSRRCVVEYESGKHAVFCNGDIVWHDGQQYMSIVNNITRKWVFNNIDPTYYKRSFVVHNPSFFEVWFCFVPTGLTYPMFAGVWNYKTNTFGERDLQSITHIGRGIINVGSDQWQAATGAWTLDTQAWGDVPYNSYNKRLIMAQPSGTKLFLADDSTGFAGSPYTAYVERTGLGFPLTDNNGPPDFEHQKLITNVWPRITGTQGGTVNVYVGSQKSPQGGVTYFGPYPFRIGIDTKIDCVVDGKLHAISFKTTDATDWQLHGYEVDVVPSGNY